MNGIEVSSNVLQEHIRTYDLINLMYVQNSTIELNLAHQWAMSDARQSLNPGVLITINTGLWPILC